MKSKSSICATLIIEREYLLSYWGKATSEMPITLLSIHKLIEKIEETTSTTIKYKYIYCTIEDDKCNDILEWKKASVEVYSNTFKVHYFPCVKCNYPQAVMTNDEVSSLINLHIVKETFLPKKFSTKVLILLVGSNCYKHQILLSIEHGIEFKIITGTKHSSSLELQSIQGAQVYDIEALFSSLLIKPQKCPILQTLSSNKDEVINPPKVGHKRKHSQLEKAEPIAWCENRRPSKMKYCL